MIMYILFIAYYVCCALFLLVYYENRIITKSYIFAILLGFIIGILGTIMAPMVISIVLGKKLSEYKIL